MNPNLSRLIIILLAIAILPLVIKGATGLTLHAIDAVSHGIEELFAPLWMRGHGRMEGIIRLCFYLIAITLLARFIFGGTGRR